MTHPLTFHHPPHAHPTTSPLHSRDPPPLKKNQELLSKEVLNLDAVESILGERPYTSATLQNIDRYRHGTTGASADAPAPAAAAAAEEGSGEAEGGGGGEGGGNGGEGGGGGGSGGEGGSGRRRGVDPGMVVAT
jgi:hypothetical protein